MSTADPGDGARYGAGQFLPWAEIIAFGLGVLRLSPDAFWSLTIPELKAAIRGQKGRAGVVEPLPRDAFAVMMRRFPDKPGGLHPPPGQDRPERSLADGQ